MIHQVLQQLVFSNQNPLVVLAQDRQCFLWCLWAWRDNTLAGKLPHSAHQEHIHKCLTVENVLCLLFSHALDCIVFNQINLLRILKSLNSQMYRFDLPPLNTVVYLSASIRPGPYTGQPTKSAGTEKPAWSGAAQLQEKIQINWQGLGPFLKGKV